MAAYAWVHKERIDWGATLDFVISWAEFYSFPFCVWSMYEDIVDKEMTVKYS